MTTRGNRPWGLLLVGALALPPLRRLLEVSMVGHMLVQIPLLVVAGALLASCVPAALRRKLDAFNANGFAGILAAGFVTSYWMLPRALDAALSDPLMELAKFCSLPLLVGLPLALSWPRLGPIGGGSCWPTPSP